MESTSPALQATLAAANMAMPAGAVLDDTQVAPRMLSVETGEFLRSAAEVGELVVGVAGGKPVRLSEVARIEDGAKQATRYVWITPGAAASAAAGSVQPAVTVTVTKKPGQNAVDVARATAPA